MEKLDELELKEKKNELAGTDVSSKSTELEQNTEQGSPQGCPAATGTSYTLCTGNIGDIRPIGHPPMAGEGGRGAGADGARGVEWAAGPWLVSVT